MRRVSMVSGLLATGGNAGPAARAQTAPAHCPETILKSETASIVNMAAMKKYVGAAKMEPDSRMPRRFPIVMTAIAAIQSTTLCWFRFGKALVKYETPLATDTATVNT